jgi:hypothetical protein
MKPRTLAAAAFLLAVVWLNGSERARAEEHRPEQRAESRPGDRHMDEHARPLPPRAEPPRFQPHPPGVHPRGPTAHAHQVRVMRPRVVRYGGHEWRHWDHPQFARPVYYWQWGAIHNVSCIAEDSYGDQYPVTEETFPRFGLQNMTAIEDDALDRCYSESGGDPSCYLATCSHF